MSLTGIFVDDAGTPGADTPSQYLPEHRKSWCAVIIPKEVSNDVSIAMTIFTEGVKQDFNAE